MKSMVIQRWYLILFVILILGSVLRFTGYNYQLPARDLVSADEVNLFVATLVQRGLVDHTDAIAPGYPPGIFIIDGAAEIIAERLTGLSFWDAANTAMAIVRLWAALTGIITAFILAHLVKEIADGFAALLVAAVWLALPNPNLQTVREMPMAWVLLFATLSLYWAITAVTRSRPWSAIASVVAGLLAVSFRYSEIILLAPAILATLWAMRKEPRLWLNTLLIQLIIVLSFIVIGWTAYGNTYTSQERDHIGGGIAQFFNWSAQRPILDTAISQIGLSPLVFVLIVGVGTILYVREIGFGDQTIGWGFIVGYGTLSTILVELYLYYLFRTPRYVTPASIPFSVLAGVGLVKIMAWFKRLTGVKWIAWGGLVLSSVAWITPMLIQSIQLDIVRRHPDTHAALINWSASNLDEGSILVDSDNAYVFSKIYGGYTGRYRIYLREDLTNHLVAEWRNEFVNYAVLSESSVDSLRKNAPNYLNQLLLINHFPPGGSIEEWQGSPVYVFRLWNIQYPHTEAFINGITFEGYDLSKTTVQAGDNVQVNLYWKASQPPSDNYNVFLHLSPLTDSTKIVAQVDGSPSDINRPTLTWLNPNEMLLSPSFQLNIPNLTKVGCYQLSAGLYNYQTGQRLLLSNGQDTILLKRICVDAAEF